MISIVIVYCNAVVVYCIITAYCDAILLLNRYGLLIVEWRYLMREHSAVRT